MPRVVIVGAGISGLALAFRLQQRLPKAEIQILESASRLGGTIRTEKSEGFTVECGPNGFLDNKLSTIDLCRDLGLKDRLVPATESSGRNRYLFLNGSLKRLPHSLFAFLRSDLLSWRGKYDVLTERFRKTRTSQDDESIDAFARRRLGDESTILADAFVTGIHAGDPALLSARSALPRMTQFESEYGSVFRGMAASSRSRRAMGLDSPKMWSFADGLSTLIESLGDSLQNAPLLGACVRRIRPLNDGWRVQLDHHEDIVADVVVLTNPAHSQHEMLRDCNPELAAEIRAIPYNRVAVVALGYRKSDVPKPLDGFGYIAPQCTRGDVLGVQWCSSIFPGRAPDGLVLMRAMCGGWHRPEQVDWDDQRLIAVVHEEIRLALDVRAPACFTRIIRWPEAIPQYHLGHAARLDRIGELLKRHRGLYLGGNAFRGVALNDCTEQATILAETIASDWEKRQ